MWAHCSHHGDEIPRCSGAETKTRYNINGGSNMHLQSRTVVLTSPYFGKGGQSEPRNSNTALHALLAPTHCAANECHGVGAVSLANRLLAS
eukprot:7159086-Alexandrium_andersonii.AAC.1